MYPSLKVPPIAARFRGLMTRRPPFRRILRNLVWRGGIEPPLRLLFQQDNRIVYDSGSRLGGVNQPGLHRSATPIPMHARKADGFAIRTSLSTAIVTEILAPPTETAIEDSTVTCCWKSAGTCIASFRPDYYTGYHDSVYVYMSVLCVFRNSLFTRVFLVACRPVL